jgi:hypothetical protein
MIAALKQRAAMKVGVDHPYYRVETTLDAATRAALIADFA